MRDRERLKGVPTSWHSYDYLGPEMLRDVEFERAGVSVQLLVRGVAAPLSSSATGQWLDIEEQAFLAGLAECHLCLGKMQSLWLD